MLTKQVNVPPHQAIVGRNKMKMLKSLMMLVTVFFLSTANADNREKDNNSDDDQNDGIQRVKCHVELLGGINTIHTFISESEEDTPKNIKQTMVGVKIYNGKTVNKKPIYKIHECVYVNEEFKRSLAKQIDENLAR